MKLRLTTFKLVSLLGLAGLLAAFGVSRGHGSPRVADSWTLVYDRPAMGKYEDFAWPDTTNGWLVSASGTIYHTADGGSNWAVQANGMGPLRSIDFIDKNRGFTGNLAGGLFATTDGGVTWNNISASLPHVAKGFCGMTHVGEQVHIVGRYTGAAADYFFSPDGGKTWRYTDLSEMAQGLVEVQFVNKDLGFIGGMGTSAAMGQSPAVILKTSDGGAHWRPVYKDPGGRGFAWKIWPINAKLIYASLQSQDGTYRMAKSTDAGDNWEVLIVTTGRGLGPGVQGIGFWDANNGWIGGFFQGMWTTSDGGKTWNPTQMTDGTVNRFERVGGKMFTAGTRGVLRYDGPTH